MARYPYQGTAVRFLSILCVVTADAAGQRKIDWKATLDQASPTTQPEALMSVQSAQGKAR